MRPCADDFHGDDVKCEMNEIIEVKWCIYTSVNLPSLVQIMACRLVGAKPLSEPMVEYYQFDPQEQNSVK